ncbi:HAD-IA family hydrolase [Acidianus brierleyi]|uniref:HAD family hydrolase n=1 Tax=Acidianus brierleyi TaxID=41673 RepID=A0A2U9IBL8_9CREN|nr:HAD-IA family hydrolase [Acidianus brierleyi]AWR93405.1 HAD-IA family hydrolase [Acidianus brierleyi]
MIKAAIFDLDGTLVSTANVHKTAWELALKDLNISVNVKLDNLMGMRTIEIAKILGGDRYLELFNKKNEYYKDLVIKMAKPTPCAVEILKNLRENNIKIAIVTSSLKASAELSLSILNFSPDLLIAGDEVKNGKPNPEPVISALNKLMVKADETFAVGDTMQDIIAYNRSNIQKIYLVINDININREEAKNYGARIINTLCDLFKEI